MVAHKFDQDLKEGSIATGREVHDLMLHGDNVPGYLIDWDTLRLEVKDMDVGTLEVLFSSKLSEVLSAQNGSRNMKRKRNSISMTGATQSSETWWINT